MKRFVLLITSVPRLRCGRYAIRTALSGRACKIFTTVYNTERACVRACVHIYWVTVFVHHLTHSSVSCRDELRKYFSIYRRGFDEPGFEPGFRITCNVRGFRKTKNLQRQQHCLFLKIGILRIHIFTLDRWLISFCFWRLRIYTIFFVLVIEKLNFVHDSWRFFPVESENYKCIIFSDYSRIFPTDFGLRSGPFHD